MSKNELVSMFIITWGFIIWTAFGIRYEFKRLRERSKEK